MDLASKLFKGDRVIWVIFMFLCLVSVIEVFSATSTIAYKNANHWAPIVRHATFLLGGFVLVLLMHNIPCRFYSLLSLLLPVSMVLLAITPFVGVVVNGEPRWLEILGIRFQPSEIAKIAGYDYTAFILSKRNWFTDKQMFWYILGGVGGVCFLIFFNNGIDRYPAVRRDFHDDVHRADIHRTFAEIGRCGYHRRLDVSGFYTVCPGQGDRLDAGSCAHLESTYRAFFRSGGCRQV